MKRTKFKFRSKVYIFFLLAVLLLPTLYSEADECLMPWTKVPKHENDGGAYPEWSATYWAHVFDNSVEKRAIILEGKFPYARYMSFVLYDGSTGRLLGSLLDKDIEPDENSVNPFRPNVSRSTTREYRKYTVKLVHADSPHQNDPNTLIIPNDAETVAMLMRIYVPDPLLLYPDRGGVALPTVSYYLDDESFEETACPSWMEYLQSALDILESEKPPTPVKEEKLLEDHVVFYRHHPISDESLYANGNNSYLTAPLINFPVKENGEDQLALVRFRAPTFPPTYYGEVEYFTGEEDVRYWSVCIVDISDGSTSKCIFDEEAVLDADGFFNLAIGSDAFVDEKPVDLWNYLPWGEHARPAVMIRQIIPREDFSGDYADAKETYLEYDPSDKASEDNYVRGMTVEEFRTYSLQLIDINDGILGDYQPKGIYCSEQAFEDGLCVIE